jgi:flavorubredoxin
MIYLKQIEKDFYWVGVYDFDLRIFDIVMEIPYGTMYNFYLLQT